MKEIKVDLEEFFCCVVTDYFFYQCFYQTACKDKDKTPAERRNIYGYYETAEKCLNSLCSVMGLNNQRAITLHRLFNKWSKRRKWEKDFPLSTHYAAIITYLQEDVKNG